MLTKIICHAKLVSVSHNLVIQNEVKNLINVITNFIKKITFYGFSTAVILVFRQKAYILTYKL